VRSVTLALSLFVALVPVSALAEEIGPARPVAQRDLTVSYEIQVTEVPAGATSVSIFLAIPASTEFQLVGNPVLVPETTPHRLAADETYGNRFLILEVPAPTEGGATAPVAVHFDVGRRAYRGYAGPGGPGGRTPAARWLAPDPLNPIDAKIAAAARAAAGEAAGSADPVEKARRVYDAILASFTLDPTGESWGQGDGPGALDVGAGGPRDLVALFVAEARSLGIAARYVCGWPVPRGETSGEILHDEAWAEIRLPDKGWLPVDLVAAKRHPEHAATFFGAIDVHRVQLTVGRGFEVPGFPGPVQDIVASPLAAVDGAPVPPARVKATVSFLKR